jgi:hypothetical protein
LIIQSIKPELILIGDFELVENGVLFDSYSVEIRIESYPAQEPKVFERAGRVQKGQHRNPDGTCCTGVYEVWRAEHPGASLIEFLRGPVRNYFIGHRAFQKTGEWPFGEQGHGALGVVEAAADFLKVPRQKNLVARYLHALARPRHESNQLCPCGSKRRVAQCHDHELRSLRKRVTQEDALAILRRLKELDPSVKARQKWQRPEIVARLTRRYLR